MQMGLGEVDPEATPPPPPTSFPAFAPQPQPGQRRSLTLPVAGTASESARSPFDLPKPTFRQTLIGGPQLPGSPLPVVYPVGSPAYPTYQPAQTLPLAGFPAPNFPGSAFPGAPVMSQPSQRTSPVDRYASQPVSLRLPSRLKYYVAFVLFMILGGGGAYMFMTRPGKLQVAVKPADARLSVDGVVITSDPPFMLEKRPGVYRLSVARPGYVTRDQNVQIAAGQTGHMDIELEPSPDTGFDLTSQPSGGLVWLDGQRLVVDEHGKQATTNFHASRIAPGVHVIEIKGNSQYQTWRQEFLQEPSRTVRLHADLIAVAGAGKPVGPSRTPPTSPSVLPPSPSGPLLGSDRAGEKPDKPKDEKRSPHRGGGGKAVAAAGGGADDVFETMKPTPADKKAKAKAHGDDDIFESHGKSEGGDGTCVATISSKPWAEVSIDGNPTGKITPLVNYSIPCGKHRITFKNADLMIERNESVTLKAGQPFKKIFSLVENEL
jgi:hypothetical protein